MRITSQRRGPNSQNTKPNEQDGDETLFDRRTNPVLSPQTQGKEERFYQTLNHEVISRRVSWRDREQCEEAFRAWRIIYNEQRPHESLGDATPMSRYAVSARSYVGEHEMEAYYDPGVIRRKVDRSGEIVFGR